MDALGSASWVREMERAAARAVGADVKDVVKIAGDAVRDANARDVFASRFDSSRNVVGKSLPTRSCWS